MFLAAEHAIGVMPRDQKNLVESGDVLLPFPGSEVPEDGEHPQGHQRPSRKGVNAQRGKELHAEVIQAVDAKAGQHQQDDQPGLAPVPEALEPLEQDDVFFV